MSIIKNYKYEHAKFYIRQNIKAERTRCGLTQFELAEQIKISESSLSLVERGKQTPSVFVVFDIAKTLDIDINELFF